MTNHMIEVISFVAVAGAAIALLKQRRAIHSFEERSEKQLAESVVLREACDLKSTEISQLTATITKLEQRPTIKMLQSCYNNALVHVCAEAAFLRKVVAEQERTERVDELAVSRDQLATLDEYIASLNGENQTLLEAIEIMERDSFETTCKNIEEKVRRFRRDRSTHFCPAVEEALTKASLGRDAGPAGAAIAAAPYFNQQAAAAVDKERHSGAWPSMSSSTKVPSRAAVPEAAYFNRQAAEEADREREERMRRS